MFYSLLKTQSNRIYIIGHSQNPELGNNHRNMRQLEDNCIQKKIWEGISSDIRSEI